MKFSLWVITDGKREDRVNKLIESCKPYKVNILDYSTDLKEFDYPYAEDTLYTT